MALQRDIDGVKIVKDMAEGPWRPCRFNLCESWSAHQLGIFTFNSTFSDLDDRCLWNTLRSLRLEAWCAAAPASIDA